MKSATFTVHESTYARDGMELTDLVVVCIKTRQKRCFPGRWRVKRWWKSKKFGTYRIDLERLTA